VTREITPGAAVMRLAPGFSFNEQPGEVVDQDDKRIRVMWKHRDGSNDKRTWMANGPAGTVRLGVRCDR
jgi:hypothetical protein